ncbi:MAG TPA: nucleoside-diphosphate sugar epimerase/dehydratase [Fervidobacterium sp.]|nr:nucleoside-diphosphate sugar epimerase/dehydratase [Fervidobacterium sp.]HQE48522.1 nucleoside-diphosphate sugar epimerase/dehydratase [Fervidobacterium sp.]
MKRRIRFERNHALFLIDCLLLVIAGLNALFVRFGLDFVEMRKYSPGVWYLILFTIIANLLNGTYKIVWRYATPRELIVLLRGLFLGYAFTLIVLHFTGTAVLPRSVGVLAFLGSFFLLLSARLFYQFMLTSKRSTGKRIGIIGAGDAGVVILNEIKRAKYGRVVIFLDDDMSKIGKIVAGVKVVGPLERVMDYVENLELEELIIAIPSATSEEMNRIVELVDTRKVKLKTVPSISQLLNREPRLGDLREISIQDIIGRQPITVDLDLISQYISWKKVLITGAGGSIGSEIARQISRFSPQEIILLGRGENSIYEIYNELKEQNSEIILSPVIADISDTQLMEKVFKQYQPDIVFHTAAHKHVFFMQTNLYEALRVNVLGTINLAKLACKYECEKFVFISTDKAVHPTSYMGASKRLAELYLLSMPEECKTYFSIVRFGNVIGSRGSVLWKFKKQIEKGGPVTITDPRMKRFWMSIPEAVSLVIQAGAFSKNRELYVLDMGKQIPVEQVAKSLANLMGKPGIEIKYTGAVSGEKLEEELFYEFEKPKETIHSKIFKVEYDSITIDPQEIEEKTKRIMEEVLNGNEKRAREILEEVLKFE